MDGICDRATFVCLICTNAHAPSDSNGIQHFHAIDKVCAFAIKIAYLRPDGNPYMYVQSLSFSVIEKVRFFFILIRKFGIWTCLYTYVYVHFGMILLIDKLQSAASVLANSRILLFPCQLIIFDVDLSSQIANWMLERNRSGSKLPLICKCYVYITSIDGVRRMEYDIPRNGWI